MVGTRKLYPTKYIWGLTIFDPFFFLTFGLKENIGDFNKFDLASNGIYIIAKSVINLRNLAHGRKIGEMNKRQYHYDFYLFVSLFFPLFLSFYQNHVSYLLPFSLERMSK